MTSRSAITVFIAILTALGVACSPDKITRGGLLEDFPRTIVIKNSDGLEQTLFITPPKSVGDDPERILEIESTMKNTSALSIPIITRVCAILPQDLASDAGLIFAPRDQPDCSERSADTLSLGPGQSTATITGRFDIQGVSPGVYDVDVQQLLKPAMVARFRFRLPSVGS